MYDVIVVGARCAGSPVAMLLARHGHRVLVLDRATFPSDTISTHYIHQTGLAKLRKWGLLDRVVATGVPPLRTLNFSYTDIALRGFADPIEGLTEVYAPRRTALDMVLVDAAREAGAELIEGFTVTDLVEHEGRVAGVRGTDAAGQEREFRAAFVVGADGAGSTVAKLVGADTYNVVPAACFVYYSYFSGLDWEMHHRTGFNRTQFAGWPTNGDVHLVATLARRDRFGAFRADPDGSVQGVVDDVDPAMGEQLRDAKREEKFYVMRYPDNYYRRSSGPGWALAGDAGYHKDPFTGWGISDALKQADLLAERLHEGLSGQRPIDDATAEYVKLRDEESAGTYALTCSVAELSLTPYFDSVFRAAAQSPSYGRKFFGLIAGGIHGQEFFDPANLEALYEEVDFPKDKRLLKP
jgi:flavin-dependent dehydrogenase